MEGTGERTWPALVPRKRRQADSEPGGIAELGSSGGQRQRQCVIEYQEVRTDEA